MKTKYITFLNHNFTKNKEIIFDYLFYSKSYNTNMYCLWIRKTPKLPVFSSL